MRLAGWIAWKRRREEDLDDEIASHLAMAVRDRVEGGEDPRAARLAAHREFGNITLTREAARRTWGAIWVDRAADLLRDAGYAVRLLVRSRTYSLTVIAVLALGLAVNVIAFSLFKALALTPLPGVDDSANLYYVGARSDTGQMLTLSLPDYRDIQANTRAFSSIAASSVLQTVLGRGSRGTLAMVELVSGNYFEVLGVGTQLGRTLLPSDDVAPGRHPVAVLADALWRETFGADPGVIGSSIQVNGVSLTVAGVAEPGFRGSIVGLSMDVFVPVMMQPQVDRVDALDMRENHWIQAFGWLRPGLGVEAAQADAEALSAQLAREHSIENIDARAIVVPLWRWPFGAQSYLLPAVALMGAMGVLLLAVVCANVAGLVLVRSLSRRGEIAARAALGASRVRIVRLLWIESAALAVPAALLGLQLPRAAGPFLGAATANVPLPLYFNVQLDRFVGVFAVAIAFASALLYGLVPALRASRIDLASVMKDSLSPRGQPRSRLRTALVVLQVAMSLILLVGTALAVRTLDLARRADAGFDADDVATITIDVRAGGYDEATGQTFFRRLLDAVNADAQVDAAAMAAYLPLTLIEWESRPFVAEGYERRRGEDLGFLNNIVTRGYFRTLRIPLLAGREFDVRDTAASGKVAIVNETFARRFWGNPADAVGKRIDDSGTWLTVVGVARDAKYARLDEPPRPYVYRPLSQAYRPGMTLQIRPKAASPGFIGRMRDRVQAVDPNLPILESRLLADQMRFASSIYETVARMLAIIGMAAMGLTALGIYGLVAYTVKQSAHEIGIRTALGASRRQIASRFAIRGVRLGVAGVVLGTAIAAGATRLMSSLLYGVSTIDALSFAAAAALVIAVALLASLVPAWRAARLDPVVALRRQ